MLECDEEWISNREAGNYITCADIYLSHLDSICTEKVNAIKYYNMARRKLLILTFILGIIGLLFAIGAAIIYGIQLQSKITGNTTLSLVFSILTGIFIFLAGCAHIINSTKGFPKKILNTSDEVRRLKILRGMAARIENQSKVEKNPQILKDYMESTNYFYTSEVEMFVNVDSSSEV